MYRPLCILSPQFYVVKMMMWIFIPQALRAYVDDRHNCEDIAFNIFVTSLSASPPFLLLDPSKRDFGTFSGLSSRISHDQTRSQCLNDMALIMGGSPLIHTKQAATSFYRDSVIVGSVRGPKFESIYDHDGRANKFSSDGLGFIPHLGTASAEVRA